MKPLLKKFRALSRGQDNREVGTPALLGTFVDKLGWKQREPHESPNKLHFLRKGQTGLVQLDSLDLSNSHGAKPFNIDIVAIHGLGGDIRETWTHKDGTFWLQDLLPRSLPGARVFSYGYPSDIFLSRSVADIRDISINLLNALETIAWKDRPSRPIVYICHSLGGIVFKQAMNIAYDRFHEVWLRSKGVVFLGTPHRGSPTATPAKLFGDILNVAWSASGGRLFRRGVGTNLLRDLRRNSSELVAIADSFTQRASALQIVTFYERYTTPPVGAIIVDQSSAIVGVSHEKRTPLYADHREICRFESQNSDNYTRVSASLLRMAEDILEEVSDSASSVGTDRSLDVSEKDCITLLNTVDISGIESRLLDLRVKGTLQWVSRNPEYVRWASSKEAKLLWVTGNPGCGKTILTCYIARYLSEDLPSQAIVCRFFCDEKIRNQRDACVLLQNVIYQIVQRRRKLLRIVRKALDAQGIQLFSRFDALWEIFLDITRHEKLGSINIVIDAIDECDEETQKMIVKRISKLLKSEVASPIKFFMTSRPGSPAVYELEELLENSVGCVRLSLEEKQSVIGEDIKLVIHERLEPLVKRGRCRPEDRSRLEEMLVDKADRTFLWVSLVLSLLEQRRHLVSPDLQKIVQQIPPDLRSLYNRFLESIPSDDAELAGKLLRIIVASVRPLTVDEIQILLAMEQTDTSQFALNPGHVISSLGSVQAVLGPLVRVFDSKVHLVHLSLKEYLIDVAKDQSNPLALIYGVNLKRESLALARSCVRYLSLDGFKENLFSLNLFDVEDAPSSPIAPPSETTASDETDHLSFDLQTDHIFKDEDVLEAERCSVLALRYKLYDYAAMHWATHFARSNDEASPELHDLAIALCDPRSHRFRNWYRYLTISETCETYPKVIDPLVAAGFFGQHCTLQRLLVESDSDDLQIGPALYWAARRGHLPCVKTLLAQDELETQACYIDNQSPLVAAAEYGHLRCLQALVARNRFDINERADKGRTPLSFAAGSGHKAVVTALLTLREVDPNLSDRNGWPPLFWAVAANSAHTITLLLADDRTDANHLDRKGRNALSYAAQYGYSDVVRKFINSSGTDLTSRDDKGWTPLIYAAQGGHLEVVQLLIRTKGFDPSGQDVTGRNAISWAAGQPEVGVLHYLLKHDREGADSADKDGWTPLAWALNPPGYPDNVSILTQSGLVNINRRDCDGRTPLSFAAGYGILRITQSLARVEGVDLESRDESGRTPFSYAAGNGNLEVVQFLIDTKRVDVDSRDNTGRTPLSWAASAGYVEVIRMLSQTSGVVIDSTDQNGRTPLWYARYHDKHHAVVVLESITQSYG